MGTDLEKALSSTQERLEKAGVSDALVREVLSYRLLIERLGETDNNSWWDSIILTDTGRDRLGEVIPQTAVKSTIDLAQRIGRKAEQDRLDSNSISLFYLGPTVEAQVSAEIEDISGIPNFEQLESLSERINETDWAAELTDVSSPEYVEDGSTVHLNEGTLDETQLKSRTTMRRVARECFVGYGRSTVETLRVPYYEIEI
jgi:hypothetical protein